jgi:hypothetical protein
MTVPPLRVPDAIVRDAIPTGLLQPPWNDTSTQPFAPAPKRKQPVLDGIQTG